MQATALAALTALLLLATPAAAPATLSANPVPTGAIDAAEQAGIYQVTSTWGATTADYDNDGLTDFLLVRDGITQVTHSLYHNEGGVFSEAFPGTFRGADLHDCPWADVNVDGLPDVFCTNGAHVGQTTKLNQLWIQQPDHTFLNQIVGSGLDDDIYGRGRAATFIDVNHDIYPDLLVGNLYPRQDSNPSPNRLYINEGGAVFRAAPEYGLDYELGGSCAQAGDFDGDGWEDLLICGKTQLKLFRNVDGASFADVTASKNVFGFWPDAIFTDFDQDGLLDIARLNKNWVQVMIQRGGLFQNAFKMPLTGGQALASGDVNGDSLPDLYVVQSCAGGGSNLPDYMLVLQGRTFAQAEIPQATEGCGDDVAPIDYDNNGTTDFIVLNGHLLISGPVQLISFPTPEGP